jgi:hypothetical protein
MGTCLRIRLDNIWWKQQNAALTFKPALKPTEIIVDPNQIFSDYRATPVKLQNICIIDFSKPTCHYIEKMACQDAYNYIEQFGLGINVYRLEEDLLDFYKNDYRKFINQYQAMKDLLKSIAQASNCYYIRTDILEERNRNEILDLLS